MPNIGPPELIIIIVISLLILGFLFQIGRGLPTRPSSSSPPDPALTALRERYARGEIDATEFEERKRTLGG